MPDRRIIPSELEPVVGQVLVNAALADKLRAHVSWRVLENAAELIANYDVWLKRWNAERAVLAAAEAFVTGNPFDGTMLELEAAITDWKAQQAGKAGA